MNSTTENKRLTRSRDDRFIGGVAAGIANHLNIDPVIVRIGFVLSIILGGIGVLAYLVLLAAVPIEGDPAVPAPAPDGSKRFWVIGGTVALGILALVSIGVTGDGFGGWMFGFAQGFWFGVLIWALAIGAVYWLVREARDPDFEAENAEKDQATAKAPDPVSTPKATLAASPTQNAPTTESPRTAETAVMGTAPAPRTDGPSTFGKVMTIIAIVMAAGFTALVVASISLLSTTVLGAIPMASVVILLGIGVVAAALNNRHQLALWTLGAAVAVVIPMAIVSIADLRIEGEYGEVRETPVVANGVPTDGYKLAAGAMTIDMRDYSFRAGQTVDLPVESGLGATRVIVPDDVCVSGSVNAKAGLAEVRGMQSSGVGFDRTFGHDLSRSPMLNIDSEMKIGLFLIMDETTFREGGGQANSDDEWDGTIDNSRLQDEAQNRAMEACDGVNRNGSKPAAPSKPDAPSNSSDKTAA